MARAEHVGWGLLVRETADGKVVAKIGHNPAEGMRGVCNIDGDAFMATLDGTKKAILVEFWVGGGDYAATAFVHVYIPRGEELIEGYKGESPSLFGFRLDDKDDPTEIELERMVGPE